MAVLALSGYGVLGLLIGWIYYRSPRLRESAGAQAVTVTVAFVSAVTTLFLLELSLDSIGMSRAGGGSHAVPGTQLVQGYLFLCVSLAYVPVLVYVMLSSWNRLLERLTSPGRQDDDARRPRSAKEEWALVESHLQVLQHDPLDTSHRRRLAEAYLRLDLVDSAISEFRKTIDSLDSGYEQSWLLFKTARLLVDRKNEVRRALPLLRRLVRIYPRSWFAAYARRVISRYEAHRDATLPSDEVRP